MNDVVIIGAGPAGLSVAAELTYHGVKNVLVVEKGPTHNQTVFQYYPDDKRVDAAYRGQEAICAGVLCFRDTTKSNFLGIVDQMLELYKFPVQYGTNVDSILKNGGGFAVSTSDGKTIEGRHVVIAIGRMGKPNRPDYFGAIPASVRTKVQFDVRGIPPGKEVLVVGGGNSAVEFALSLAPKGPTTISYRQTAFSRLNPMNRTLLEADEKSGRLKVLRGSNVKAVIENGGRPFAQFVEGGDRAFDYIVYGIGGSSPAAFLQNAGIDTDDKGNPKLDDSLQTTVQGLYVIGELAVPLGKGSIIKSFNLGKRAADTILHALGIEKRPDVVHLTGA